MRADDSTPAVPVIVEQRITAGFLPEQQMIVLGARGKFELKEYQTFLSFAIIKQLYHSILGLELGVLPTGAAVAAPTHTTDRAKAL
jgi:hypothetical protein